MSVDSAGIEADSDSFGPAAASADGRWVAFYSRATNLVAGDTNGREDIFVHDRETGATTRVSVTTGGAEATGDSGHPAVSGDGRWVAFDSEAADLVAGDTNGARDVFVHDRQTGETTRVSVDSGGTEGNRNSGEPAISSDGRWVAFHSSSTNLVAGDTNGVTDVFVHDRDSGETTRVSVDSSGDEGNNMSLDPVVSADGRWVAFWSHATDLATSDTNGTIDVFLHDRTSGVTMRVSVATGGLQADGSSFVTAMSADGRWVAFHSFASNLVPDDTNSFPDVFVHDRDTGETTRVSVATGGGEVSGNSFSPAVSADGRRVAFESDAMNLVTDDSNGITDVFVHDRDTGETTRVSVDANGAEGTDASNSPAISADGRWVTFQSYATNLVADDLNGVDDVYAAPVP